MGPIAYPSSSAQRRVPPGLCLQALFGGPLSFLGWVFFGLGMVAFWGMVVRSEAFTLWQFRAPLATAAGTVTRVFDTGGGEGGSDGERGAPIYGIVYTFTPPGPGVTRTGTSYQLGSHPRVGETVTVEYRPDRPGVSRIQGLRTAVFGPECAIPLIFPLIGLACFLPGLLKGWRASALLRRGVPAIGILRRVERTMVEVNDAPVFRFFFDFTTGDGRRLMAKLSTASPAPAWMAGVEYGTRAVDLASPDAPRETVLYDPANPNNAFVPAQYGWRINVDDPGAVQGGKPLAGFAAAILPGLVIAGNLWYVCVQYWR